MCWLKGFKTDLAQQRLSREKSKPLGLNLTKRLSFTKSGIRFQNTTVTCTLKIILKIMSQSPNACALLPFAIGLPKAPMSFSSQLQAAVRKCVPAAPARPPRSRWWAGRLGQDHAHSPHASPALPAPRKPGRSRRGRAAPKGQTAAVAGQPRGCRGIQSVLKPGDPSVPQHVKEPLILES